MRGEILNELIEFAAESLGAEATSALRMPGGSPVSYEAGRSYEVADLDQLIEQIASAGRETRGAVLMGFGRHLFGYFAALYPAFLDQAASAIALLARIDTYVHGELKKVYPSADFPSFTCTPIASDGLEMVYRSARPLADLAEGLIRGCVEHFGEPVRVGREDLPGPQGTAARFVLTPER